MPQNPPHWRKPARTHQTLTRHTSGQPKWPKPVYNKHFLPDQDPKHEKTFENVARDDTPSINLQPKCASHRESSFLNVRAGPPLPLTLHFPGPYSVSFAITCTCSRTLPYVGSTGELPQIIIWPDGVTVQDRVVSSGLSLVYQRPATKERKH